MPGPGTPQTSSSSGPTSAGQALGSALNLLKPKTHKPKTHKAQRHKAQTHKKSHKPKSHKPKPHKAKTHKPKRHQRTKPRASQSPAISPAAIGGTAGIPTFVIPPPPAIGVPNFFIDSFQIPPFLLPIYQAAGIEYGVPWQVLAAINEIETDYGRNLSVSSAGAVGWMQFLPSTWRRYAVDATGSGVADPYNPADAIFTAARYLQAAGAAENLPRAIYAYNHTRGYVESVLLRAELIGGMPKAIVDALSGLVEGEFPVAAPATYAEDSVLRLAGTRMHAANAAVTVQSDRNSQGTDIYARQGSPVVAVSDGKIVKIGQSPELGRYIVLQDATGNTYTYAQLGSIPAFYPVPKPVSTTRSSVGEITLPTAAPRPMAPASAGSQTTTPPAAKSFIKRGSRAGTTPRATTAAPMVKERLFADPARPASYAAGGGGQIRRGGSAGRQIKSGGSGDRRSPGDGSAARPASGTPQLKALHAQSYFPRVLHLARDQYTLARLRAGSVVVAGTLLGRVGAATAGQASRVQFMIQPAGNQAPYIDPKPILDGWRLLEATALYRAAGRNPFLGSRNPTIGQILLMSKQQLQNRVLQDPGVRVDPCVRRDIQAGQVDRRILAAIEFLSTSGLQPSVSGIKCGSTSTGSGGIDATTGATGSSVEITAINGTPIKGHQGPGSITDLTVRRLLTLQGAIAPDKIVSLMSYKGEPSAISQPNHADRIQVSYTPLFGQSRELSAELATVLNAGQWAALINRLSRIPEPVVPISPSSYAIKAPAP